MFYNYCIAREYPNGHLSPYMIGSKDVFFGDNYAAEHTLEYVKRQDSSVEWAIYKIIPVEIKLCECP